MDPHFTEDISRHIWETKYRYWDGGAVHDHSIDDTWRRVAQALASVEKHDRTGWEQRFYRILQGFQFVPGGRILAGAGTPHRVTLFNCFVMGRIEDALDSIFDSLKEGALTMQQGGGIGYDFSTLRPQGTPARTTGTIASGPVSFMRIWDSMCATILSTGVRRGAMMATLRCDHPDIEAFIEAKQDRHALRHFNLSVLVTDAFVDAVRRDDDWLLVFPTASAEAPAPGETVMRSWPGYTDLVPCRVFRRVPARPLWCKMMRAAYEYAEPGVLFIDRINRLNNLWYREQITAANPCGEIPLPPYGACNLGSVNLTCFVHEPFSRTARLDLADVEAVAAVATRLLDNVIDVSHFPLEVQARQARGARRIGLGMMGLADTLIMLGLSYDSPEARTLATAAMRTICYTAYYTSSALALEKGSFPFFDRTRYLQGAFIAHLPTGIREAIARDGLRNSHLTAIAPTGTISLLANNVSSGIEPVYDWQYARRVLGQDGAYTTYHLTDYGYRQWQHETPVQASLPPAFITARTLPPQAHLAMQAALQPYVDNAISKTINVPDDYPFDQFEGLYEAAYAEGLKGCTTFRPNTVTGAVLETLHEEAAPFPTAGLPCCSIEPEAD